MTTYQPYTDFTAQSHNVSALMRLYAALEDPNSAGPPLVAIVVFTAFSIESYLNSIGARQIPFWGHVERLPWGQKVDILHINAKKQADWGRDPLQFAADTFRLRDRLAHGKPERVLGEEFSDWDDAETHLHGNRLLPDWYKSITSEWVQEAKERFRLLMEYLGSLYGLHASDHLHASSGGLLTDTERG